MANLKLLAIKMGDELKYGTSLNQINRIAEAIFDFDCLEFPQDNITSERAQLIYDWVITLDQQELSKEEKLSLLGDFYDELSPEDYSVRDLFGKKISKDEVGVPKSPNNEVKQQVTQHFHGNIENFGLGDINNYNTTIYLNALIRAIDESDNIPPEEKKNLVDKVKKIANNPYVSGIGAGLIVEAIKTGLVGK